MTKIKKRILAWILVAALLLPVFGLHSQAAVVTIRDAELKEFYLNEFNTVVNAVKKDRPGVTVLATGEVSQSEDQSEDKMAAFAKMAVKNVFSNDQSLAADLLDSLNENNDYSQLLQPAEVTYDKGALKMDKVPVAGKDYVSDLTMKYNFTMKMLRNDEKKTTEILIQFPECTLLEALDIRKSDMSKVFDLPTNTDVILSQNEDEVIILEGGFFQLDDIVCTDAYVDIKYNDDLELISYTSNINYRVKVSTYTVLESLWPTFFKLMQGMGLDVGGVAKLNVVSLIMSLIGAFTDFDPEESMSSVYTDYTVMYQMYKLNWAPRYFGDINWDNRVGADDARAVLRTTIGYNEVTGEGNLYYADVDFDGKLSAGDARLILRMAVNLDPKYTSYEMYKELEAGRWEDPDTPLVPDTPPVIPDEPDVPEIPIE